MNKIKNIFGKGKSKNSRSQKKEILEELKKLLQQILRNQPLKKAIDYIDDNSDNFNFSNIDNIFSQEYIAPMKYQKNAKNLDKLKMKLQQCVIEEQKEKEKQQLKVKKKTSIDKKKQSPVYEDSFQVLDESFKYAQTDTGFYRAKNNRVQTEPSLDRNDSNKSKSGRNKSQQKVKKRNNKTPNKQIDANMFKKKKQSTKQKQIIKKSQTPKDAFFQDTDSDSSSPDENNPIKKEKSKKNTSKIDQKKQNSNIRQQKRNNEKAKQEQKKLFASSSDSSDKNSSASEDEDRDKFSFEEHPIKQSPKDIFKGTNKNFSKIIKKKDDCYQDVTCMNILDDLEPYEKYPEPKSEHHKEVNMNKINSSKDKQPEEKSKISDTKNNIIKKFPSSSDSDEEEKTPLKFERIFELIEDQSSEQSLNKTFFLKEKFEKFEKISQIDPNKEFCIIGFYGQIQLVIEEIEDWMEVKVNYTKDSQSKFQVYIGQKGDKIAVFLDTDDNYYMQPYIKNLEIADFINILQDLASEVRLCIDPEIQVNDKGNPFDVKTKARKIGKIKKNQQYKLQVESLQNKNKLKLGNYDQYYLWSRYLIQVNFEHIQSQRQKKINVKTHQDFDDILNLKDESYQEIPVTQYSDYLKENIDNIVQERGKLDNIIDNIRDEVYEFIVDEQQKMQLDQLLQQIKNEAQKEKEQEHNLDMMQSQIDFGKDQMETFITNTEGNLDKNIKKNAINRIIDFLSQQDNLDTNYEQQIGVKLKIDLYQFGFPSDNSGKVISFQLNDSYKSDSYNIDTQNKNKVYVEKVITIDEKRGLLLLKQKDESCFITLQFSINEKQNVDIQPIKDKYATENQFYVEQLSQKCVIWNNNREVLDVSSIGEKFLLTDNIQTTNIVNKTIKANDGTQYKIEKVKDYIYFHKQKFLIFLDQDNNVFKKNTKTKTSLPELIKKTEVTQDNQVRSVEFRTKQGEKYQKFIQCINDNYILLKHNNGIDIYDLNYCFQHTIQTNNQFKEAYVTQCNDKQYLIILSKNEIQCYSFQGQENQQREHVVLGNQEDKPKGNAYIDYFFSALLKYGSNAPYQEEIVEKRKLQCSQELQKKLKDYLKKIKNFKKFVKVIDIQDDPQQKITWRKFSFTIKTRAPLHVASIESQQLYPLKNGKNNRKKIQQQLQRLHSSNNQQEIYFHQQIKVVLDEIKMGVYEEILSSNDYEQIKVVCTMGRQSLGKSYLLNRLFGTRFNVDSKRCTDGLWLSMSVDIDKEGKEILYVIIDCEGLFNVRRVIEEELQLVVVCAGISNLTIFNSENNFGRRFDQFFGQLARLSRKFKGQGNKYYKGSLLFLIRDIAKREKSEVMEDFSRNIRDRLLKDAGIEGNSFQEIIYDAMVNFENKEDFIEDLKDLKKDVIGDISFNISNAKDFLQNFKLLLSKVYFGDDQDLDLAMLRMKLDQQKNKYIDIFYKGNDQLDKIKTKIQIEGLQKKEIQVQQSEIKFERNSSNLKSKNKKKDYINQKNFDKKDHPMNKEVHNQFIKLFSKKIQPYNFSIHDIWMENYYKYNQKILKERIEKIVELFEAEFAKEDQYRQEINQRVNQLKEHLSRILNKFTLCKYKDHKCRLCKRRCVYEIDHEGQCLCFTDHKCDKICSNDVCKKKGHKCDKLYGHEDKHLCSQSNHFCQKNCSMQDCEEQCKLELGHAEKEHNCQKNHECKQICSLEGCNEQCVQSLEDQNHVHQCQNYQCPEKCIHCDKKCIFPDHFHKNYIQQNNKKQLKFDQDGTTYKLNHHNCGDEHICQKDCQQDGICECNYKQISKNKQDANNNNLQYDYTIQTEKRNKCQKKIEKFKEKHKGKHDCEKETDHRCNKKCPECQIFCEKEIGHEGFHSNAQHRNKDNAIYGGLMPNGIVKFEIDGQIYEFNIGDNAENERCMSSCIQKGRSHVHLMKCKGGEECYERQLGNDKAKHVNEVLDADNPNKKYDQILCQSYFDLHEWYPPAYGEEQDIINKCSVICNHYEHKRNKENDVYCVKQAWHDGQHDVGHTHRTVVEKIQVAFILDCTRSMGVYMTGTKKTVQRMTEQFIQKYQNQSKVEFGVVAYTDHGGFNANNGFDDNEPISVKQFTDSQACQNFIQNLNEGGGFDIPEAVVDGFYGVLKLKWIEDSLKFVFLITDGPPHGEQFSGAVMDRYPDGCPCGKEFEEIIPQMNEIKIKFRMIKIGEALNIFEKYLMDQFTNYETLDMNQDIAFEELLSEALFEDLRNEYFEIRAEE